MADDGGDDDDADCWLTDRPLDVDALGVVVVVVVVGKTALQSCGSEIEREGAAGCARVRMRVWVFVWSVRVEKDSADEGRNQLSVRWTRARSNTTLSNTKMTVSTKPPTNWNVRERLSGFDCTVSRVPVDF